LARLKKVRILQPFDHMKIAKMHTPHLRPLQHLHLRPSLEYKEGQHWRDHPHRTPCCPTLLAQRAQRWKVRRGKGKRKREEENWSSQLTQNSCHLLASTSPVLVLLVKCSNTNATLASTRCLLPSAARSYPLIALPANYSTPDRSTTDHSTC
jgi:hypothetical protein